VKRTSRLLLVAAAIATVALSLERVHLPSPELFAGVLVGLAHALWTGTELRPPRLLVSAAHAVVGVVMGVLLQPGILADLAANWFPITGITLATLALTVVAGLLLARFGKLDRSTAAFGMIAGGAAGIVALSDESGADGRVVAVLQYVRVLMIIALMPVAVVVVFGGSGETRASSQLSTVPWWLASLAVLGIAIAGTWVGRLTRLPVPSLLGPLTIAGVLTASGLPLAGAIPGLLPAAAFAVIGAQVGLRFTADTLRTIRRILPLVVCLILALILACAGLGVALSAVTGLSPLDGYLATTPGGLFVVAALAAGSEANSTVVIAVQVLRMLVMLLAAPPLARLLRPR
jgi:membrane AbrB-like protein